MEETKADNKQELAIQAGGKKPVWHECGMLGWIRCGECKITLLIKEAKTKGCPKCGVIYLCLPSNITTQPQSSNISRPNKAQDDAVRICTSFYFDVDWLNFALQTVGGNDPSEILPGLLYLGSEFSSRKKELLQERGVKYILNVTTSASNEYPYLFNYMNIRIDDEASTNILQHFEIALSFIRTWHFLSCFKLIVSSCLLSAFVSSIPYNDPLCPPEFYKCR